MIKLFLVINNLGKVRISKFYESISAERQQDIITKLFEIGKHPDGRKSHFVRDKEGVYGKDCTIVMRQYATLTFIMIIDEDESELSALDLIQIIVEGCDTMFENVCELDMVHFPDRINALVDEIIIGGHVIETKIADVMSVLKAANDYELSKA